MTQAQKDWRRDGVRIVRATALRESLGPSGLGRATVFDFAGPGGNTWIGSVVLPPKTVTGKHHHGHHEIALLVAAGRSEIRWGERLELGAEIGPGDWAYFPPFVPHQERNLSESETLHFIVVRNDSERIAVALPGDVVDKPEIVA
jgi:uncharacterized RmlC-like cupin family protein